ncbi:MAG: hypothetical protein ACRDTF_05000 [Pseudonocardiaceae bacterium]
MNGAKRARARVVRDGGHRDLDHARMLEKDGFDLERREVDPTNDLDVADHGRVEASGIGVASSNLSTS